MQKKLNWSAYSGKSRNELIEKIKNAISANDGSIINFNMFSDLSLVLNIEIPEDRILDLHNGLKSFLTISDIPSPDIQNTKKDWLIFLNISFGRGMGDLKSEIPDVPG